MHVCLSVVSISMHIRFSKPAGSPGFGYARLLNGEQRHFCILVSDLCSSSRAAGNHNHTQPAAVASLQQGPAGSWCTRLDLQDSAEVIACLPQLSLAGMLATSGTGTHSWHHKHAGRWTHPCTALYRMHGLQATTLLTSHSPV